MNIVNSGSEYMIYGDDFRSFPELPAGTYKVEFSKMRGFYLTSIPNISISEKIYGVHITKLNKVFNSFGAFERSLGVILSGDKGIGKSLFAKLVMVEAVKKGLPVILVNNYIPGIADYIASIDQETLVVFDEFDKTFKGQSDASPQDEMLTLFDGVAQGKKLYVITCNKLIGLNDYLVNRPGRFHYHFRFEYPTPDEIREYLRDKMSEEFWTEIENVVRFSKRAHINYDCLRAIAFELNTGISFSEAIKDINIVNTESKSYNIELTFANGRSVKSTISSEAIFDGNDSVYFEFKDWERHYCSVSFSPSDLSLSDDGNMHIDPKDVNLDWSNAGYEDRKEVVKRLSEDADRELVKVTVTLKSTNAPIHYVV